MADGDEAALGLLEGDCVAEADADAKGEGDEAVGLPPASGPLAVHAVASIAASINPAPDASKRFTLSLPLLR